jgi:hypothetical protein
MQIIQTITEVSELQKLEKQVDETAAVVADWKNTVAKIQTELNIATLARDNATKAREKHALAAAMQDAHAVSEIKHARSAEAEAAAKLADLAIALPAAEKKLADAERGAASARHELGKLIAEQSMRKRIALAGQIDGVIADFSRLFSEYEKLGHEIINMDVMPQQNMFGSVNHDGALGLRRMRAALPKFFDRVYPNALHDEMKKENLAITEARQWSLAPVDSESKAA